MSLLDLEVKLSTPEVSKLKREFITSMLNEKGAWLDRELKKIVPPEIHRDAWDTSGTDDEFIARQERVKKWLDSHDIRLEEHGLHARLFRGKEKISTFVVKLAEK